MLYILLPAYNEEKDLGTLLERIDAAMQARQITYKLLVVNDGSRDRTAQITRFYAQHLPVMLLDHTVNQGLGQAMLTGLLKVVEIATTGDVVVAMDADNTHDPALIPGMLELISSGNDVVIASRYARGGQEIGLAIYRRILSRGVNTGLSVLFPVPGAKDYTCGYRAYRIELLQHAFAKYGENFIEERGFTCMAEILLKLSRLGIRVIEAPLVLRYDYKSGASKMKVFHTIRRYFTLCWQIKYHPLPEKHPHPITESHPG